MGYLYQIFKSYFFGAFPPRVNWAITDICNSKCIFCEVPCGFKGKEDLTTERALGICEEFVRLGVKEAHLVGGEVFVRKDIWEIIKKLRSCKIDVVITTNGLAFNSFNEEQKSVIRDCVKKMRFSLDSTDIASYDRIRGVNGAYDKVSGAIKEWVGYKKPKLAVSSVIMDENIDEIPKIIRWCADNGIDFADFQPVSPVSIFSNMDAGENKKTLVPGIHDMARLDAKVKEGIALADELGVVTTLSFFKSYAKPYFLSVNKPDSDFFFHNVVKGFSCLRIFMAPFLDYDGTLRLCPLLKGGVNIKEKALADAWKELKGARTSIKNGHFPPNCKFCFCNIAENILFSVLKHPVSNRSVGMGLMAPFLRIALWQGKKRKA